MINIFVSYSHKNYSWIDKEDEFNLVPYLAESLKYHKVKIWYDPDLKTLPGIDYERKIISEINKAQIAILLLSQDFINSDFINKIELPEIKKRNQNGTLEIVPILVEPWFISDLHPAAWLVKTQIIPGTPTALSDYTDSRRNFLKARKTILASMERIISRIEVNLNSHPEQIEPERQSDIMPIVSNEIKSKVKSFFYKKIFGHDKIEEKNHVEMIKPEFTNQKEINKSPDNLNKYSESSNKEGKQNSDGDFSNTKNELEKINARKKPANVSITGETNTKKNISKRLPDVCIGRIRMDKLNIPIAKSNKLNTQIGEISLLNQTAYTPMDERVRIGNIEIVL
ncbi:MAG: toll/interleukin-1 receptor domain-containing protein [Candidatus Cloacimonetes bacterium]|nr:toll/interleukin-1 receptor domain-containing protein [Candidatus Cloacimonadota bacterium]